MIQRLIKASKFVNYLLAFWSMGLGIGLPFFQSLPALPQFETFLFSSFFISFGIAFVLFAQANKRMANEELRRRKRYFVMANLVTLTLWTMLLLNFDKRFEERKNLLDKPSEAKARIYKIDPEGYRKERTLYYTFEYKGQRYTGKKVNPSDNYSIGDSVLVLFSQSDPEQNKIQLKIE